MKRGMSTTSVLIGIILMIIAVMVFTGLFAKGSSTILDGVKHGVIGELEKAANLDQEEINELPSGQRVAEFYSPELYTYGMEMMRFLFDTQDEAQLHPQGHLRLLEKPSYTGKMSFSLYSGERVDGVQLLLNTEDGRILMDNSELDDGAGTPKHTFLADKKVCILPKSFTDPSGSSNTDTRYALQRVTGLDVENDYSVGNDLGEVLEAHTVKYTAILLGDDLEILVQNGDDNEWYDLTDGKYIMTLHYEEYVCFLPIENRGITYDEDEKHLEDHGGIDDSLAETIKALQLPNVEVHDNG